MHLYFSVKETTNKVLILSYFSNYTCLWGIYLILVWSTVKRHLDVYLRQFLDEFLDLHVTFTELAVGGAEGAELGVLDVRVLNFGIEDGDAGGGRFAEEGCVKNIPAAADRRMIDAIEVTERLATHA